MTGLHEAFDDIAAEITPNGPPVDVTMLRGHRMRRRRLTAVIAGTTAAVALVAGAAVGIPALTSHQGSTLSPATAVASPVDHAPLMRPVLLLEPHGSTARYGDASLVNAATLKLFRELNCEPGPSPLVLNDGWKSALGYTAAQWNAPGNEVVSCDATGAKYVLGKAAVLGPQVTSAAPVRSATGSQWNVNVTLNPAGAEAFGKLTTSQFNSYSAGAMAGNADDVTLASDAFVMNGDVTSAPVVEAPLTAGKLQVAGPQPAGFTKAEAAALAARLWAVPTL